MVYSAGVRKVLWEVTSKLAVKDEQDLARQNFMLSQKTLGTNSAGKKKLRCGWSISWLQERGRQGQGKKNRNCRIEEGSGRETIFVNGSWRSFIHSRNTGSAQNVCLDFPLISCRKTQMNFLANPVFIYCWALERQLKTDPAATPLELV